MLSETKLEVLQENGAEGKRHADVHRPWASTEETPKGVKNPSPSALAGTGGNIRNSNAVPIASCVCYALASIAVTLTNTALLTSFGFPFAFALLVWQHVMTVGLVVAARVVGVVSFDLPAAGVAARWVPLNVIFCLMLLSNTYSLKHISLPMVVMIKSLGTVFTAVLDAVLFGQNMSPLVMAAAAVMVASSVVAGLNDLSYNSVGYLWSAVNCLASVAYALYMRLSLKSTGVNEFAAVFLNNLIAIPGQNPLSFLCFRCPFPSRMIASQFSSSPPVADLCWRVHRFNHIHLCVESVILLPVHLQQHLWVLVVSFVILVRQGDFPDDVHDGRLAQQDPTDPRWLGHFQCSDDQPRNRKRLRRPLWWHFVHLRQISRCKREAREN